MDRPKGECKDGEPSTAPVRCSAHKNMPDTAYFCGLPGVPMPISVRGFRTIAGREYHLVTLTIHHRTTYRYRMLVGLGPHRLMLRPRESRDVRVISSEITVSPAATVTWANDVSGNAIATASFVGLTNQLVIDSVAELQLSAVAWPIFDIAGTALYYPFQYSADEWTDLGALATPQYPDPTGQLGVWARSFILGTQTDTLSLLRDLSARVSARTVYEARDDEGTQSPTVTLERARGSCRDFAVLFIEGARTLGFGARVVSGYLCDQAACGTTLVGSGSTHAWAEVYVPGAGWITFDPTNRSMGGFNLIPVAVTRHIGQSIPVAGSYSGPADAFLGMSVDVRFSGQAIG
jgi:transglutaminase-like putative cysteine protease